MRPYWFAIPDIGRSGANVDRPSAGDEIKAKFDEYYSEQGRMENVAACVPSIKEIVATNISPVRSY